MKFSITRRCLCGTKFRLLGYESLNMLSLSGQNEEFEVVLENYVYFDGNADFSSPLEISLVWSTIQLMRFVVNA